MSGYFGLIKHQWTLLSFGFLAVFFGNVGQTFFVGVFSAPIQQSLNLSASAYGTAYSLATLASAATVVWAGSLIDSMPLRRYTTIVCLGLASSAALLSQATSFVILIAGFFALRLFGQALLPHTGSTTIARHFETHRGKALSISSSGFPAGEVILPAMGIWAIGLWGWQHTYLFIALFVLVIVLPLMLTLIRRADVDEPDNIHSPQRKKKSAAVRKALLTDYRYWLALPGLMAGPFIATGIFIHQDFVIQIKEWTPTWFALCFVVYGVVHWLSTLVSGTLVDRFTAARLLPFYLLPMALSLIALAFFSGQWLGIVFMSLLAMSIGSSPPISGSLWPEIYGVDNLGTVRSINIAILVFATALSPALYGLCIDQNIPQIWIFGSSAAYVLLASLLYVLSYAGNPEVHPVAISSRDLNAN